MPAEVILKFSNQFGELGVGICDRCAKDKDIALIAKNPNDLDKTIIYNYCYSCADDYVKYIEAHTELEAKSEEIEKILKVK